MKPKISVCMATFNGSLYIKEQLDSIISQISYNDEIIISDGGSSDQTINKIINYDSRITVLISNKKLGVVENFHKSLSASTGDIIFLADQDDIWLPNRVNSTLVHLKDNDLVLVNAQFVDSNLNSMNLDLFHQIPVRGGVWNNLLKNRYTGCCMAFNRELLDFCLPFPSLTPHHDWLLGFSAELYFRVYRDPKIFLLYRRHPGNDTLTGFGSKNSFIIKILRRFKLIFAVFILSSRYALSFLVRQNDKFR